MKYLSVFFIAFLSINISVAQEVKVAIDSTLSDGVSFKPVNEF